MDEQATRILKLGTRIGVPVAILLLAVVVFWILQATAPKVREADTFVRPTQVPVFEAVRVPVQRQWQGYGTGEARTRADVPARITATVLEIPEAVEAGRPVEAGQLLVQLDPSDFQRQVEVAEQALAQLRAQLAQWEVEHARLTERLEVETEDMNLAQSELDRVRQFVERGGGSQQDVDRARRAFLNAQRSRLQTAEALDMLAPRRLGLEAQITSQESTLKMAQTSLERAAIVSPITGYLQSVDVKAGESVQAGQRVARVVSLDQIDIPIRLPSTARASVHVGDGALVEFPGWRGRSCPAEVTRMAPEDDPQTRTMTVYVTVSQDDVPGAAPLTPGTFVSATINGGDYENRWVVPRRAIRGGRMYMVVDGTVQTTPVTVDYVMEAPMPQFGLPDNQWAVLEEQGLSLRPGQLVMVNAAQTVLDGERVHPVLPAPVTTAASEQPTPQGQVGVAHTDAPVRQGATP